MYTAIKSEIKKLAADFFTGHVKFGIEKGQIVTEIITTRRESTCVFSGDYNEELKKIDSGDFYGTVEYDFDFGKVVSSSWTLTLKGESLQKQLRTNQCRNVRVVVKK